MRPTAIDRCHTFSKKYNTCPHHKKTSSISLEKTPIRFGPLRPRRTKIVAFSYTCTRFTRVDSCLMFAALWQKKILEHLVNSTVLEMPFFTEDKFGRVYPNGPISGTRDERKQYFWQFTALTTNGPVMYTKKLGTSTWWQHESVTAKPCWDTHVSHSVLTAYTRVRVTVNCI